jgi:5-methylcytosine-specific restriction endonuclease McrA
MPIKPENRERYPANWKQIRARILARAEDRCEQCKALNGSIIVRGTGGDAGTYMDADAEVYDAETGKYLGTWRMSDYECNGNGVKIVLTIAHMDHVPEHCDDDNLKALCQRCHLAYDAEHHAETSRATRRARKAIGDLFEGETA